MLIPYMSSDKMDTILNILKAEKAEGRNILPEQKLIFRAFRETPLRDVRVIILGQDVYPSPEHACGLAFSIPPNVKIPASLTQIFQAIEEDVYAGLDLKADPATRTGDLTYLCKQGVLLLNAAFTVEQGQSGIHLDLWKPFIHYVIAALQFVKRNLIWLAWGGKAEDIINTEVSIFQHNHFVLKEEHPVAASRDKRKWKTDHFSRTNAIIIANKLGEPIKW
jgi:uracil-DNA glycosylase